MRVSLQQVVERRGARLHLGDDGEGGGVDVAEGEEAEQVHDEVDHLVRVGVRVRARVRVRVTVRVRARARARVRVRVRVSALAAARALVDVEALVEEPGELLGYDVRGYEALGLGLGCG